jgi:hypothetical protein
MILLSLYLLLIAETFYLTMINAPLTLLIPVIAVLFVTIYALIHYWDWTRPITRKVIAD